MAGYIAYLPFRNHEGQNVAVGASAPTVGNALKEVASKMNAAVAAAEGYAKTENGETLVSAIVFEVPDGVESVRHEIEGDNFKAFGVRKDDEESSLRPIFFGAIDPIKIVDGRVSF